MAVRIPKILSKDLEFNRWQDSLDKTLYQALNNPLLSGNILESISLESGTNVVNHKLNRKLMGWFFTRIDAAAEVYDEQDTNTNPYETLILVSDAAVTVDLYVF